MDSNDHRGGGGEGEGGLVFEVADSIFDPILEVGTYAFHCLSNHVVRGWAGAVVKLDVDV